MTILATHFSLVLGAWRLRVRIDLDEPSESQLHDDHPAYGPAAAPLPTAAPHATWGRG